MGRDLRGISHRSIADLMWKDWLIAGPVIAFTLWVLAREFLGKRKKGCSGPHSIYGIPDDFRESGGCSECPALSICKERRKDVQ